MKSSEKRISSKPIIKATDKLKFSVVIISFTIFIYILNMFLIVIKILKLGNEWISLFSFYDKSFSRINKTTLIYLKY